MISLNLPASALLAKLRASRATTRPTQVLLAIAMVVFGRFVVRRHRILLPSRAKSWEAAYRDEQGNAQDRWSPESERLACMQ
jgi:hypothetical protein